MDVSLGNNLSFLMQKKANFVRASLVLASPSAFLALCSISFVAKVWWNMMKRYRPNLLDGVISPLIGVLHVM